MTLCVNVMFKFYTYLQGMFNGSLLLVAVLGGPGFLLFMLYNCYRKNNVTFLDALFHFFPFLKSVKESAESLSETAQKAAASFQSSEGNFSRLSNLSANQ